MPEEDDQTVVEYATVTAALALLASSLSGALGSALPASDVEAAALVGSIARSHHLSGARARAAYRHAPYRKPALRYLYAVGFVGSASDPAACRAARVLGPDPKAAAADALRRSPQSLAAVRGAHVTLAQAAAAIGRGTVAGCA
ncbi:MAG TPA: hypothetical protein VFB42_06835 [Gaiellaceae bacterium]|nr:hypothetical protein [Gaiellaceae bacterium]